MKAPVVLLAVVVAVLAVFVARNPMMSRHIVTHLTFGKLPFFKVLKLECDDVPFLDFKKSSKHTINKHCFNETGQIFWYDVNHNETLMREILTDNLERKHCPVLIHRPFKDHKCFERIQEIAQDTENSTVRVKVNQDSYLTELRFPQQFYFDGLIKRSGQREPLKNLLDEYAQGPSMRFSAFETSMGPEAYQKIWNTDLGFLKGQSGTTFFSNYNRTAITTPFHSAFLESFGYQCEGTKTWHMMTPTDAVPMVRYHSHITIMKNCDGRADIDKFIFQARTDPDTLFYFPPFWAHSVETKAGLSVLMNFRGKRVFEIAKRNLHEGLITFYGLLYHVVFFSNYDPDEVVAYYNTGEIPPVKGNSANLQFDKAVEHFRQIFFSTQDKLAD